MTTTATTLVRVLRSSNDCEKCNHSEINVTDDLCSGE